MKRIISTLLLFLVITFLVSCSITPSSTISTTIATNPTKSLIPDITSLESSFSTFYQNPISQSSLDALASIINTQGFTPEVSFFYDLEYCNILCSLNYWGKTWDESSYELNFIEGNYLGYMILKGIAKHPDFIAAFTDPENDRISYHLEFDAKSQDQYANDVNLDGYISYIFAPGVLTKVNWDNMDVNMKSNPAALIALVDIVYKSSFTDGGKDSGAIWDYYGQ